MDYKAVLKDAVEIVKLNKSTMEKVAGDKNLTVPAILILVAPFVVNLVLSAFQTTAFLGLQMRILLVPLLSYVAVIFLMSLAAQLIFKVKGDHFAFFRVLGFAGIVSWLSVIAFVLSIFGLSSVYNLFNLLNIAAAIWGFVVTYHILQTYYKLNQQNAIITIVIGVVGVFILNSILGNVLVGRFYGMMY